MKKIGDYYHSAPSSEQAFLVGVSIRGTLTTLTVDESLDELTRLARTAGMVVVGRTKQNIQRIDASMFIGRGKADEIRSALDAVDANVIIFDDELSPRHQRELDGFFGENIKVLDRSALILDIFAQHARTREGALQVELAQYEYRLPRLTRQWTHLARQAGGGGSRSGNAGVGLRGPGETQLEVDRREISRRITKLRADLDRVRQHRSRHRAKRTRDGVAVVALVGYTNAGKSTLMKALTGADAYIADQLFATLDPLTRHLELPSGRSIVISDTVGFIQKLPTTLIAAFRATLEEITEADILLHVVDVSHPNVLQHIDVVEDTLAAIDIPQMPRILVWNKIDCIHEGYSLESLRGQVGRIAHYDAQVAVSASERINLQEILEVAEQQLTQVQRRIKVAIPYSRGDLTSLLYQQGAVIDAEHKPEYIQITARVSTSLWNLLQPFQVEEH